MPIHFISGGNLTLRQSLEYVDRGSRSPHPGGGNNMTTVLMQLGIPTVLFWEVKAGLSGYEVTKLGDKIISLDSEKCGPWAQFEPELWRRRLESLPKNIFELVKDCSTPYQVHLNIAQTAFSGIVESSASFYLKNRNLIEPVLHVLAKSRFAGYFSKRVFPNGRIASARNSYEKVVVYEDGSNIAKGNLASNYLTLLEVVRDCELNNDLNPLFSGAEGVLPDARIMSVLDMVVFSLMANSNHVYAWSGVAMFQYILKEADSQRWREVTSQMYDLCRREVLPQLPETLNFVLIPTQGLGQLAVIDAKLAHELNTFIAAAKVPPELNSNRLAQKFRYEVTGLSKTEVLTYLSGQTSEPVYARLKKMIEERNIDGACGVAAHYLQEQWRRENKQQLAETKKQLSTALVDKNGKFILHNQRTITPLEILQGQQLFLIEGVLDTPTGKLEALRSKYQQVALGKAKEDNNGIGFSPYSHAGWDW